jgi:hypothetical protein
MSARRDRMAWKPNFLQLETRDVPTVISPLAFGGAGLKAQQAQNNAAAAVNTVLTGQQSINNVLASVNVANVFQAGGTPSPAPITQTQLATLLTPAGKSRARFVAHGSGPFAVGHTSYTAFTKTVTYIGPIATNQFMQGTLNMQLNIPKNFNPSAGELDGFAALRSRTVGATGTVLVLDLSITAEDSLGRPTIVDWVVDDNGSGGSFGGASGVGTLTISYNNHSNSKDAAGGAKEFWSGFVMQNGVNNITDYDVAKFN